MLSTLRAVHERSTLMGDTKDKVKGGIDKAADKTKDAAGSAVDKTRDAAKSAGNAMKNAGDKVKDTAK
jgi:hypothetical protein